MERRRRRWPLGRRGGFLAKQAAAVAITSAWAFAFTYGMLWIIDRITPVRVGAAEEAGGLDAALHGEEAYPQGA